MVSNNQQPDSPPPGWKVQSKIKNGRKYKCFINLKTRQKLYSKAAVLRYIKDGCVSNENSQTIKEHAKNSSGKMQMQLVEANDDEWLPTGWVVERRIRKSGARAGTKYKCYIDQSTGAKFFSKPEVLRYLDNKQCSAGSSKRKDRGNSGHSSCKGSIEPPTAQKSNMEPKVAQISKTRIQKRTSSGKLKVVTERTVDEELPSGWIKELRIKMLGNKVVRRDPFYPDPASTLVFRSKLEVLRYLETGEISRHAFRRNKGSIIDEDFSIEKTSMASSGRREQTPIRRTRKQVFAGEASIRQSIHALPEAQNSTRGAKDKKLRSVPSRSSKRLSGVDPESVSNCQQMVLAKPVDINAEDCNSEKAQKSTKKTKDRKLNSVPSRSSKRLAGVNAESVSKCCQEMVPAQPFPIKASGNIETVGTANHTPPDLQDADREPSSALSGGILPEEKPVDIATEDYCIGKTQIRTRKTKNLTMCSGSSRSSKRLAGVDAEVVFHPIPIEHVLREKNRKPSRKKQAPKLESVPNELQEKNQDVDTRDLNEHALRATSTKPFKTGLVPSLESVSNELQAVNMQDVLASQEAQEQHHALDVDPETVLATQGEPLSMLDNLTSHELCYMLDVDPETVLATEEPSNEIDDLASQEEKHRTVDSDVDILLTTKGESSNKVDDLTFEEEKHHTLDVHTKTLSASQGEPLSNIDNLKTKRTFLVDLNELLLEQAPPGFSEKSKAEASSAMIKQLDHPTDTVLGSKAGNTSRERPILEETSKEQLTSIEREPEQPQSEFCFSSPLWSDPCLEFAYKTLTGALPFDDNLAIDDYIQHQLRTSKPCSNSQRPPEICAPSFFKNDEAKLISQLPEDVNFPNSNGFGSPEMKQVKHK